MRGRESPSGRGRELAAPARLRGAAVARRVPRSVPSGPAELLRLPAGPPSPCHRLAHLPSGQAMAQACGPWLLPSQTKRKAGNCFCRRKQNVLGGRVGASPGSRQLPTRLRLPLGWGGRCQPSLRPALAPLWALIYSGAGRRGCLIPCPPLRCREEELPLVLDAQEA